jgi:Methyltransferase domain
MLNLGQAPSVYRAAEVYDLAFSYRNIRQEVSTVLKWYRLYGSKATPRHVLELAAGPARHAREFSRRGLIATALDSSPDMCRFALAKARKSHVPLKTHCGQMESLDVPGRFDLVVLMLDSATHILSKAAMDRHLESISAKLVTGGIYVLELAHCGKNRAKAKRSWTVKSGSDRVRIQWGVPGDHHDISTSTTQRTTVRIDAELRGRKIQLVDRLRLRHWTARDMDAALHRCKELEAVAKYGDFRTNEIFDPTSAWRLIYVLRKRESSATI